MTSNKFRALSSDDAITARSLIELAKIEQAARNDAVRNLPLANDPTPPPAVLDAREIVSYRIETRFRARLERVHHIHDLTSSVPDPRLDRNITGLASQVEARIMAVFQETEPLIRKAVGEQREAATQYKGWCDERKLHRLPNYPLSKPDHYAWVAAQRPR